MVSNRSFDRLNLTHKRTLAFRCYCFLFLRNCTLTFKHRLNVLPIIADCILYIESDENWSFHREELNLLLDSISTLCSFQCSRSTRRGTLLYYQTRTHLSTTFFKFFNFCFRAWRHRFRQLLYITKWYTYCQPSILSFLIKSLDRNSDHFTAIKNRQRPTFPGSFPPSIISAKELNYCVRDGNRCDLLAIVTGFSYEGSHPQNWTM